MPVRLCLKGGKKAMMTVFYKNVPNTEMNQVEREHHEIYQNYINGKYEKTHKRISNEEFWTLTKIFICSDKTVSVVTGNQHSGGCAYIKHCKSFDCFIDRKNNVIVLMKKSINNLKKFITEAINAGTTLSQVSNELDCREKSGKKTDDRLFGYSTKELEQIEMVLSSKE